MFERSGSSESDVVLPLSIARVRTVLDHIDSADPGLRLFRQSPETVVIQIRTHGKVTSGRRGITRKAYSQAVLTLTDLDDTIAALRKLRKAFVAVQK